MPTPSTTNVEETITLDIKGGVAENLKSALGEHEQAWTRIASHVEGIGNRLEGITRSVAGLAGLAGVGALVADFTRLENSANQAALAIGNVTGAQTQWSGLAQGLLGLQARYGLSPQAITQSVTNIAGLSGGSMSTQQALQLGQFTGLMGQGTGLDPGFLGTTVGQLSQAGNLSPQAAAGQLPQVAATLGQIWQGPALGTQLSTTTGLAQMLASRFPFGQGQSQLATQISGQQIAAQQQNRIYNDPAVFGGAISSLSSGFNSALSNPSAAWLMRIAGVPVMDMIAGNPKPQDLGRIKNTLEGLYGKGPVGSTSWIESYLTLQSVFGQQGANLIMGVGGRSDPASEAQTSQWMGRTAKAAAGTQTTLAEQLAHVQGRVEQGLFPGFTAVQGAALGGQGGGIVGDIAGALGTPQGLIGGYLGLKGLRGLGRGVGSLLRGGGGAGGAAADETGASAAEMWAAGGEAATGGSEVAGFGLGLPLLGLEGTIASIAAMAQSPGPGALTQTPAGWRAFGPNVLGHTPRARAPHPHPAAFDDPMWHVAQQEAFQNYQSVRGNQVVRSMEQQYGPNWFENRKAIDQIKGQFGLPETPGMEKMTGDKALEDQLLKLAGKARVDAQKYKDLGPQAYWEMKFGDAVTQFEQAVEKMQKMQGPTSTSYDPSGRNMSQFVGAPAASSMAGGAPGLEYASLITAGGASSPTSGGSPSVSVSNPGGGGGGGGGTGHGSWQTAVASWYDPGQGGINGSYGSGAWSGHPIEPSSNGFAHKTMAFGTQVEFQYHGKTTTATCMDRGPFVAGRDFDLLPIPARAIGMTGAGVVTLQWRMAGGGGGGNTVSATTRQSADTMSGGGSGGGGGAGGGSGGAAMTALASAVGNTFGGGGGSGDTHIHVHIDGREIHKHRLLTKGRS